MENQWIRWSRNILRTSCVVGAGICSCTAAAETSFLSISPASTNAGSPGAVLNFTVTRSGDLGYPAAFNYRTADGSALAGRDYTAVSGQAIIAAGAAGTTISVPVVGSAAVQPDRQLSLVLSKMFGLGPAAAFNDIVEFASFDPGTATAAADFNGDGRLDLAVEANLGISIFLNITPAGAAAPSFAVPIALPVTVSSGQLLNVVSADFNADGRPDLLFIAQGNIATVLINTTPRGASTLSFGPAASFQEAVEPRIADFNLDGRPDVLLGLGFRPELLINVTPAGASSAAFARSPLPAIVPVPPPTAAVADVNGDGRADYLYGVCNPLPVSCGVRVAINTMAPGSTAASFVDAGLFPTGVEPRRIVAADFNTDARIDIAVATSQSRAVTVLLNSAAVGAPVAFEAAVNYKLLAEPVALLARDFNGDGRNDLLVTLRSRPDLGEATRPAAILENATASGASGVRFIRRDGPLLGQFSLAPTLGDFNNDGVLDIASVTPNFGSASESLGIAVGQRPIDGAAPALASVGPLSGGQRLVTSITSADFNSDGKPDLAGLDYQTPSPPATQLYVLLNTATPGADTFGFSTATTLALPASIARAVVSADFNLDGRLDLATANGGANTVSIVLNDTAAGAVSANLRLDTSVATAANPFSLASLDINNDGKPDLASANADSRTISLLVNTTTPGASGTSFVRTDTPAIGCCADGIAAGDVNLDGRSDLALALRSSNQVTLLLNRTPAGSLTPVGNVQSLSVPDGPSAVALVDLNGDRRVDIAVTHANASAISVLLNTTPPTSNAATFAAPVRYAVARFPVAITAADLNGDGRPELLVGFQQTDQVHVLRNDTSSGAATPNFTTIAIPQALGPTSLVAADFTLDGDIDIATATSNYYSDIGGILNVRHKVLSSDGRNGQRAVGVIRYSSP
ncbi:MAG: hypothetical protein C0434_14325 [Xanthomonadaceae bacterium]|nr:hypothetical protein [Xanthomonadaceae bacterium]